MTVEISRGPDGARPGQGCRIKVGAKADIAVFDPETFAEAGTTFSPNRLAGGMRHLIVNGMVTLRDGTPSGERAGRVLLRHDSA